MSNRNCYSPVEEIVSSLVANMKSVSHIFRDVTVFNDTSIFRAVADTNLRAVSFAPSFVCIITSSFVLRKVELLDVFLGKVVVSNPHRFTLLVFLLFLGR